MDVQRDQGIALLLDMPAELVYLAFVDEQLPWASGVVISGAGLGVRGDVHAEKKKLIAPVDTRETLIEADLAVADALDLSAEQVHAGFQGLQDEIVVVSLAVDNAGKMLGLALALFFCFSSHICDQQRVLRDGAMPIQR